MVIFCHFECHSGYHCQSLIRVDGNQFDCLLFIIHISFYIILLKMVDLKFKYNFTLNGASNQSEGAGSATKLHPSPKEFVAFIPWACREFGIENIVEVTRTQLGTLYNR